MNQISKPPERSPDPPPADRAEPDTQGPSGLTLLLMAAVFVVGGYFLTIKLHDMSRLQDCVMSGRTNCAPVGQ